MKLIGTLVVCLSAAPCASLAQDGTDGSLPESLRIQQSVTQQNANDPLMRPNTVIRPTTEAPGSAGAPVELNRIDPAAPSQHRLQIEDGTGTAVRQNPDFNALHPGSAGASYNTILRGAPSSSGASSGASGVSSFGSSRVGSGSAGRSSLSGSSSSGGGR